MSKLVFSSIKVCNDNQSLVEDKDGRFKVILGAFNSFNGSGAYYSDEGVRDLIEDKSSVFYRRLTGGYLRGEVGHPPYVIGMSNAQFYARNIKIDMTNVSHHIDEIELVNTGKPSGLPGGGEVILVYGYVTPSGVKGDALLKDLRNKNINTAFSIRCVTKDEVINGVLIKKIIQIITWDWVVEPGMKKANKFDSVISMESLDICDIDVEKLLETGKLPSDMCLSTESAIEYDQLAKELISKVSAKSILDPLRRW